MSQKEITPKAQGFFKSFEASKAELKTINIERYKIDDKFILINVSFSRSYKIKKEKKIRQKEKIEKEKFRLNNRRQGFNTFLQEKQLHQLNKISKELRDENYSLVKFNDSLYEKNKFLNNLLDEFPKTYIFVLILGLIAFYYSRIAGLGIILIAIIGLSEIKYDEGIAFIKNIVEQIMIKIRLLS